MLQDHAKVRKLTHAGSRTLITGRQKQLRTKKRLTAADVKRCWPDRVAVRFRNKMYELCRVRRSSMEKQGG